MTVRVIRFATIASILLSTVCLTSFAAAQDPCGASLGYEQGSPWPTRGRCSSHVGQTVHAAGRTNEVQWRALHLLWMRTSPVIAADGTVYVIDWLGNLYAYAPNGVRRWQGLMIGNVDGTPAIGPDGTVYAATDLGNVYAFDPVTGIARWMTNVTAPVRGSITIAPDGALLFGTDEDLFSLGRGKLVCLNPNGTPRWQRPLNGAVRSTPALDVATGRIYVGTRRTLLNSNSLYAVNLNNGAVIWQKGLGADVDSSPVLDGAGRLYVGTDAGRLYAVNTANGNPIWNRAVPCGLFQNCQINGDPAIAPSGNIVFGSNNDHIYVYSPAGVRLFDIPTGGDVWTTPAIDRTGLAIVGSDDWQVRAIDTTNGQVVWTFPTGGPVRSSAAIDETGTVYFGSDDWRLYAVGRYEAPPEGGFEEFDLTDVVYSRPTEPQVAMRLPADGSGGKNHRLEASWSGEDQCDPDQLGVAFTYDAAGEPNGLVLRDPSLVQDGCEFLVCGGEPEQALAPQPSANDLYQQAPDATCEAVPPQATCGVDHNLFNPATAPSCASNAQCAVGQACVEVCGETSCDTTAFKCATLSTACGGLPQESNCEEISQCAEEGVVLTQAEVVPVNNTGVPLDAPFMDTTPPNPPPTNRALRDADPTDTPAEKDAFECNLAGQNYDHDAPNSRNANAGSDKWAIHFGPNLVQEFKIDTSGLDNALVQLKGEADLTIGATLWGQEVNLVGLEGRADASLCGVESGLSFKLLGKDFNICKHVLATGGTPEALASCRAALSTVDEHVARMKKGMLDALRVYKNTLFKYTAETGYAALPALSQLCRQTAVEFSQSMLVSTIDRETPTTCTTPSDECRSTQEGRRIAADDEIAVLAVLLNGDPFGSVVDPNKLDGFCSHTEDTELFRQTGRHCRDFAADNGMLDAMGRPDLSACDDVNRAADLVAPVINRWIEYYEDQINDYLTLQGEYLARSAALSVDEDVPLFTADSSNPDDTTPLGSNFTMLAVEMTYPIGPITAYLEIQGTGFWQLGGNLHYAVDTSGLVPIPSDPNWKEPHAEVGIAFYPAAGISASAYIGAGVGGSFIGADIGIQGSVDLIDIAAPIGARLTLDRETRPDSRDGTVDPASGDFVPDLDINELGLSVHTSLPMHESRWLLGYGVYASADVETLRGRIDLKARVRIWPFKKTFKRKIADLPGYSTQYTWVADGVAADVALPAFGPIQAEVTFPRVPADFVENIEDTLNGWGDSAVDWVGDHFLGYQSGCVGLQPHLN